MKQTFLILSLVASFAFANYPHTPREVRWDRTCGIQERRPFAWMENLHDLKLYKWVEAQNAFAYSELSKFMDTQTVDVEDVQALQDSLQRDQDGMAPAMGASPKELESPDTKHTITYSYDEAYADLMRLRVMITGTKTYTSDFVTGKFMSFAWAKDAKGFYYTTSYDGRTGDNYQYLKYHALGTHANKDKVLIKSSDPNEWVRLANYGGAMYVLKTSPACVKDMEACSTYDVFEFHPDSQRMLVPVMKNQLHLGFVGQDGDTLYFSSYTNAPLGKIFAIKRSSRFQEIVFESKEHALERASLIDGKIVASVNLDGANGYVIIDPKTRSSKMLPLPAAGKTFVYKNKDKVMASYRAYNQSSLMFEVDLEKAALKKVGEKKGKDIRAKKVMYKSVTGRMAPIWVIYHKDNPPTANGPMMMKGYGGFSLNYWVGGIAVPSLKIPTAYVILPGGLEYGEPWHQAARVKNKHNVYNDFAGAARALVAQGLTTHNRIVMEGGSNGGLLVSATVNLHPNVAKAVVNLVGVNDFPRFGKFTGGKWWMHEYGDSRNCSTFRYQRRMSPMTVRTNMLPNTLIIAGDRDDRVVPSHSYMYAAQLQSVLHKSRRAYLLTARGGAHGYGASPDARKVTQARNAFIKSQVMAE